MILSHYHEEENTEHILKNYNIGFKVPKHAIPGCHFNRMIFTSAFSSNLLILYSCNMNSNLWKEGTQCLSQHACGSEHDLRWEGDIKSWVGRLRGANELCVYVTCPTRKRTIRRKCSINQMSHVKITWNVIFFFKKRNIIKTKSGLGVWD